MMATEEQELHWHAYRLGKMSAGWQLTGFRCATTWLKACARRSRDSTDQGVLHFWHEPEHDNESGETALLASWQSQRKPHRWHDTWHCNTGSAFRLPALAMACGPGWEWGCQLMINDFKLVCHLLWPILNWREKQWLLDDSVVWLYTLSMTEVIGVKRTCVEYWPRRHLQISRS